MASIRGFDLFEAGGAGFGLRDFAADIVGGAGVQRPDGGFVEDVIRVLIPGDDGGFCFREGAFGLAEFAGVGGGGGVGGFCFRFFGVILFN